MDKIATHGESKTFQRQPEEAAADAIAQRHEWFIAARFAAGAGP